MDGDGASASWPEVAEVTGRTAHPLMQWHALVGSEDALSFTGSLWPGEPPKRGDLAPDPLKHLSRRLADHTSDDAQCFFGLWIGWDWVRGGVALRGTDDIDAATPARPRIVAPAYSPGGLGQSPLLMLPDREYLVLCGRLTGTTRLGSANSSLGFEAHSPNLLWPEDRAWFMASEIDFDSTLVGGTRELINAILQQPELDSWLVSCWFNWLAVGVCGGHAYSYCGFY
jgi:hypothetical protein